MTCNLLRHSKSRFLLLLLLIFFFFVLFFVLYVRSWKAKSHFLWDARCKWSFDSLIGDQRNIIVWPAAAAAEAEVVAGCGCWWSRGPRTGEWICDSATKANDVLIASVWEQQQKQPPVSNHSHCGSSSGSGRTSATFWQTFRCLCCPVCLCPWGTCLKADRLSMQIELPPIVVLPLAAHRNEVRP